ncbi:hypothetical protein Tco_0179495 [Tanacetum coccineum]
MASEQQTKKLTPSLNVNFECEDGIINFNNEIALLECKKSLFHPMLQYSTTNTLTFTLSSFDKPLSFNLDEFSTIIDLKPSRNCVSLPPKETMRASLATLGLIDENDTSISSFDLANSSSLKMRYFSLIWRVLIQYIGLDINIGKILFFDLLVQLNPGKKERKLNVCYTRYLSLIIEHLLGDTYNNNNLKTLKPYHITASSFKTLSASEVPLNSHMLKMAKISEEQYKSLIISSRK